MVMPHRVLKMPAATGPGTDKAVPVRDGRQTVPADPELSKRRRRPSLGGYNRPAVAHSPASDSYTSCQPAEPTPTTSTSGNLTAPQLVLSNGDTRWNTPTDLGSPYRP